MAKRKVIADTPESIAYWITHPVEFVEVMVLGLTKNDILADVYGKRLEPESKAILHAVGKHDYVSVHSGKGVTKTFSLGQLVIWFLYTRRNARVAATGPKFDQLKVTLWAEIQKWLMYRPALSDQLRWHSEGIKHVDERMNSFGFILTSKEKENIQGVHGDHVLWIVDEASNVDNVIYETIMSGMNDPECKIVLAGNPTKASGFFFDSFNRDKNKWKVLHFSSEDSARARANKYWWDLMQRYPRDSDIYRVNVLGLPPRGNPKAIISLEECCQARDRSVSKGNFLEMGVDPAAEGDDLTTIAIRQGMKLLEIRCFPKTQAPEVCNHTLNTLKEYRARTGIQSKVRIKVDDTSYGQAIRHFLSLDQTNNIEVVPCLFGGKGNEEYKDYATIMWYELRDQINQIELPDDEDLISELSTRESRYVGQRCTQVEPKRDFKKRIGHSPDRSDACIMCFAKGPKKVFSQEEGEPIAEGFEIDWTKGRLMDPTFSGVLVQESIHYAALVLNKDLSITGLAAVYQFIQDTLWIYAEFHQETPIPDLLSRIVRKTTKKGLFEDERDAKIIGNKEMFRQEGDRKPLSDILRRENLSVMEAYHYDEYGAIALGSRMWRKGQVKMHLDLDKSRSEINLWSIRKGTTETEKNGFCKAFLLILSEVQRQQRERPIERRYYRSPYSGKPNDYTPQYGPQPHEESETAWMAR
jgi:hypothetical protein